MNAAPPLLSAAADFPVVGRTIACQAGDWGGAPPIQTTPQWLRCDITGEACLEIAGATAWSYTTDVADIGSTLRLQVRATNVDGSATARTRATPPVTAVPPTNTALPVVVGGWPIHVGGQLEGRPGTWFGTMPIQYAAQWLRCDGNGELCIEIAGATGWSYELVQADVGHTIRLEVAAANAQGIARARCISTQLLPPNPPRNVVSPRVTGTAARRRRAADRTCRNVGRNRADRVRAAVDAV